jgi:2-iminobutanoate/2-iminopropanoate deaminase
MKKFFILCVTVWLVFCFNAFADTNKPIKKIVVKDMARLPTFCHAVVAGDFVFVSGTLGTKPGSMELAKGGTGPETAQALRNIETILKECGASLEQVVKVNVYLARIEDFPVMNKAYMQVMGSDPPARITVGKAGLALGAAVEIDAVAYIGKKK